VRNLLPVYSDGVAADRVRARKRLYQQRRAAGRRRSPDAEIEGQPKAESAITFTFVQAPIITIAHWIPASRQILADAKMLGSYIDQRLRYGVLLEEEDEVLNSTGTNGELNGLSPGDGVQPRATADSRLDTMLKAFLQVTLSDYAADGVVMSNVDWTSSCS
jgi:HK97 family phage major capsid protein